MLPKMKRHFTLNLLDIILLQLQDYSRINSREKKKLRNSWQPPNYGRYWELLLQKGQIFKPT